MEDSRFAHIATDPKFRRIPKSERKVKIDKRFQFMFNDKKFKVNYTVDKRGRPVNHTTSEDLKRYYELSSEDSSSDNESEEVVGKYVKAPSNETEIEDDKILKVTDKFDEKITDAVKKKLTDLNVDYARGETEIEDDKILKVIDKFDEKITDAVKKKLTDLNVDYARGEGKLYSESSSDESEEEESDSEVIEHKWGELDADAERTDETTHRLAACNMDWDRIRAIDLMVLFNSFITQGGLIKSVVIYPSEFGLQRLKEEETRGPIELVESKVDDGDEENEEGSKYHMEKLRQYQLNRLKYYYAVITCDTASTANKIYTECDGMEYESTSTKIDLRFIPDDMTFDAEPKEICDKLPELTKYQPRFFTTTALQQAKVNLTWDETNPERIEITQKLATGKVDEVSETDLQAYLASSSGEEDLNDEDIDKEDKSDFESQDGNPIDKYKALLNEIENKEKEKENRDVEMEVSWGIDLEEKTEKMVKKKLAEIENKTPFQKYLDKRKEKRKEKRKHKSENLEDDDVSDVDMSDPYFAEEFNKPEFKSKQKDKDDNTIEENQKEAELELLLMNEDDGKNHFSFKKIQDDSQVKKRKNKKKYKEEVTDDFDVKVDDDRFSALYTSHHFNIDPTDPHYKKTKGMEKIINEKLKRRNEEDEVVEKKHKVNKKSTELNVLVKSVKRKAEAFTNKKSN